MPLTPVTPKETPTWAAMPFDGTAEHVAELAPAIDSALLGKHIIRCTIESYPESESTVWRMRLVTVDGAPEMVAIAGTWVAAASTGAIRVLSDADYHAEFDED